MGRIVRHVADRSMTLGATAEPVDIYRDRLLQDIVISYQGTVTNSTGATSVTPGNPFTIIKDLWVSVGGRTLKSIPYVPLRIWATKADLEVDPYYTAIAITSTSAQPYGFDLVIPFANLRAVEKGHRDIFRMGLLPAFDDRSVGSLMVGWTWGAKTDLMGGATSSAHTGTARVLVTERGTDDMPLDEIPGGRYGNLAFMHEGYLSKTWTTADTNMEIELPRTGALRAISLFVDDNGTASDTDVNKVTVQQNGVNIFGPITWTELTEYNNRNYKEAQGTRRTGFNRIDFNPAGDMDPRSLVAAEASSSIKLILDVDTATAGRIRIHLESYKRLAAT